MQFVDEGIGDDITLLEQGPEIETVTAVLMVSDELTRAVRDRARKHLQNLDAGIDIEDVEIEILLPEPVTIAVGEPK